MVTVIFIGVQASGKSTFFQQHFRNTHVRINLDMLKTRHRENVLFQTCLSLKQPCVIDNTNPTLEDRQRYISPACEAGFRIVGYYFQSQIKDVLGRNAARPASEQIPEVGVLATYDRLILPSYDEGFDKLHFVSIGEDGSFHIEDWKSEVRRTRQENARL